MMTEYGMRARTAGDLAVASELIAQLQDARARELELFSDLADEQLLGPAMSIIEPPLWEIGHVGWFQERWILRHLDGADPLLPEADRLYELVQHSQRSPLASALPLPAVNPGVPRRCPAGLHPAARRT